MNHPFPAIPHNHPPEAIVCPDSAFLLPSWAARAQGGLSGLPLTRLEGGAEDNGAG